jgi:hypothetical protein
MKTLSLVLAFVLLAPFAFGKNDPATSAAIAAPVDVVKSAIVARLTSHGFHLESDSQFQMVWSKEMDGGKGMLTQLIAGNANCAMPKAILSLTFAPEAESVTVSGTSQIDKAGTLCVRERIDLNGKNNRAEIAAFLADIKSKAETQIPAKK